MDLICAKTPDGFRITDPEGEEALKRLKTGALFMITVTQQRNLQWLRRWFVLVRMIFDNQSRFTNFELFRKAMLVEMGYADPQVSLDGKDYVLVARSVAFNKMKEDEFERLWADTCDLARREFMPGITDDQFRSEVELLIGDRK